jgi:hypothetical protein
MGAAYLNIDGRLLRDLLHFPCDTAIEASVKSERCDSVRIVVSSPDIPDDVRQVNAIFRTQHGVSFFDRWVPAERGPAEGREAPDITAGVLVWMIARGRPVLNSEIDEAFGSGCSWTAIADLQRADRIRAVFPEAKAGDSGRQFWEVVR